MIDPSRGISIAPYTSPSTKTPPIRRGAGASVVVASSNAASFAGCRSLRSPPSRCPITGWATAAMLAKTNGIAKPSLWWRSRRPRSMPTAYTPAIVKPTTM